MKAIEITTKTDKQGLINFSYPTDKKESKVRIVIFVDENNDDIDDDALWLKSISSNPAFDFLKSDDEDIYSLKDGEPFHD